MTISELASARQGIQSVEVAAPLLRALADAGDALPLSTLAKAAGMPPAKAHRYLVSLIRVGLVQQDAHSGAYDLGPLALELGLAAQSRIDAVKLADQTMASLRDATGETVALAVWGNQGPTIIRLLQSRRPVMVNLQIGSVLPMTYTASGLCFATWMPAADTAELLELEFAANRRQQLDAPVTRAALQPLLHETAQHGLARMIGQLDPAAARPAGVRRGADLLLAGFNAWSAPVFDHDNRMRFALTVVGASVHIGSDWDGAIAVHTRDHARALSRRLGQR
ncbi:MAG: IclR family transcriptional regulator [Pseudomonadota bacterium]|nr:IclR family transcriptional regulator [Pseudomonadota bacterium]